MSERKRPDGRRVECIANRGLSYRVIVDDRGFARWVDSKVYTGLGCFHYRKIWDGKGEPGLTALCAIRSASRGLLAERVASLAALLPTPPEGDAG